MAGVTIYPCSHDASTFEMRRASSALASIDHKATGKVIYSSFDGDVPAEVDITKNGLIEATIKAYSRHHHLKIRPDDIWLAIMTQFGFYVNVHSEEIRHKFVSHEGKKELVVYFADSTPETVNWNTFAQQITKQASKYLKDPKFRDWILPSFTTTTQTDLTVASVTMMSSLQGYFMYTAELMCGLPSVTLLGKKEDYENILQRLEELANGSYGPEPAQFANLLKPIVKRFVRSFEAPDSGDIRTFWNTIFTSKSQGSGPVLWSGWLTAFMFWDKDGQVTPERKSASRSPEIAQLALDGATYPSITNHDMPPGFNKVPIKIIRPDFKETRAEMLAASVGVEASSTGKAAKEEQSGFDTRQPVVGWWVYEKH